MSFDETPKVLPQRPGLKPINGQKSMFDGKPKPPTQQEFEQKVQESQNNSNEYKNRAAELFIQFSQTVADKTLPQHRNMLNLEVEKEMLQNMVKLAIEINNDGLEQEGMGSLTWITCLLKTCLSQRDRINELEYSLYSIQKKLDSNALAEFVNKEIVKALSSQK